jgi:hypothetical protein
MCDREASRKLSSRDVDSDFAKELAAWRVASSAVPADLTTRLLALKARIARLVPAP